MDSYAIAQAHDSESQK